LQFIRDISLSIKLSNTLADLLDPKSGKDTDCLADLINASIEANVSFRRALLTTFANTVNKPDILNVGLLSSTNINFNLGSLSAYLKVLVANMANTTIYDPVARKIMAIAGKLIKAEDRGSLKKVFLKFAAGPMSDQLLSGILTSIKNTFEQVTEVKLISKGGLDVSLALNNLVCFSVIPDAKEFEDE
jgi:hypothetical protein